MGRPGEDIELENLHDRLVLGSSGAALGSADPAGTLVGGGGSPAQSAPRRPQDPPPAQRPRGTPDLGDRCRDLRWGARPGTARARPISPGRLSTAFRFPGPFSKLMGLPCPGARPGPGAGSERVPAGRAPPRAHRRRSGPRGSPRPVPGAPSRPAPQAPAPSRSPLPRPHLNPAGLRRLREALRASGAHRTQSGPPRPRPHPTRPGRAARSAAESSEALRAAAAVIGSRDKGAPAGAAAAGKHALCHGDERRTAPSR